MNCREFCERLDEYRDGALDAAAQRAARAHLDACAPCRARLARANALRQALRAMPVIEARPNFFEQALANAGGRAARRRAWWPYVGGALAASLALWLGVNLIPSAPSPSAPALTAVTIALHEPRTVQLAFNAAHALEHATVSITLPEGVEVDGFPGQREIRWQTNLAPGVNVLALPLLATNPTGGALLARLEHGARATQVSVPVRVSTREHSGALLPCTTTKACRPVFREIDNNVAT